ncbi:MAG: phosphatidylglycerol lysyltransferase domain-containing protein [Oscillospiraceae bacterium]|jgi:hypothetical protein|nr:phosphatidylglycerol lysyltransferase domain-containing protein [Oscillospiraceae bacterium]
MLDFKKLTLNDLERTRKYFQFSTNRTCDNTIGGTFMWRDYFGVEFAEFDNTLVFKVDLKYHNGATAFTFPLGEDINGSVKKIEKYCTDTKTPLVFCTVVDEELRILKTMYNNVQVYQETNWSDYLYKANDLITLAGRKYSGQRNHINNFMKMYIDYSFEEISEDNLNEVKEFYKDYCSTVIKRTDIFFEEQNKTIEVLDNYDIYNLFGGLIRVNGAIAAFSIGEICRDVLFIHIEKANLRYKGIYQMINKEFAGYYASDDIEYINREEDVGDEGLRTSKKSYHPHKIIDKYIIEV